MREIAGGGAPLLLDACRGNRTAGKATFCVPAMQAAGNKSGIAGVEFALIMPVLLFFALRLDTRENSTITPLLLGNLMKLISGGLIDQSTAIVGATAIAGSGTGTALDVMLILDTTASMNTADTSCSISGATRVICAEAGARTLLQQFKPSLVHVGLMLFPGVSSATDANDYDCSSATQPTIVKYSASPTYQIIGLSSDYKTSDTASSLNTSSNLVKALGGGASGCTAGLSAVGGVATIYADVITAAQTALATNGRTGVQKVIIFLSDGDANASASNVPTGKAPNQCHEGITAAQAATAAGTKVYSLAYGAPTSGSCSTDSPAISACQAMQQIAST